MEENKTKMIYSVTRFRSTVWKDFGFYKRDGELDKTMAICKHCRTEVRYTGSTTNMSQHLKRHHSTVQSPETSASSATATTSREPRIPNFFQATLASNSARANSITDALSFFLCKGIQPYNITANEGFKYLLEVLEPRYSIPDRRVFSDRIVPALYEKVKVDVLSSMGRAKRVSITVDGWTSCATDSYITVTAHYVNEEWDMQSHVLQTRVFNESHTGVNLAALLQDVLREWNLGEKKPALVTDNARNMLVAGAGAEITPHVRCVAHTLNLASQKALKVDRVSELLVKVRKVVTYFHKSPQAAEVLREIQSQLRLPNHKLIHDVCTRWNSSVDMLERFWEQQPALLNAMLSRRIRRGEGLIAVNEDDMTLIQEIIKLMSPVKVATTLLSEEKSPTISMIAPIQAKLHKHFSEDNTDLPIIADMKQRFRQDFFDRYLDLQELLYNASGLDPRFKDLAFLDDVDSRDLIFMKITSEVVKMNEQAGDSAALYEGEADEGGSDGSPSRERRDGDASPSPKKKTAMDQLFGEFITTRTPLKTMREKAKDEILKYRERDSLELGGDVLQWWKGQVDLPLLSALAKDYLSIPATSVSSERVFSSAGNIVTAQRSLLHPDHVDQLIFLKKNLKKTHLG
ncbi:E3 SUMO-protein ligase ZBED1-like [Menidia menidia]